MDNLNFNGSGQRGGGGASVEARKYGQAALILVESLMHALVEKGVISRGDFVYTVEGAAEVEQEMVTANSSPPLDANGSLLLPLAVAFKRELGT